MRALNTLLLLTTISLATAACSQVPEPASYIYSTQEKLQAVHHWDLMAKDVTKHIFKMFAQPINSSNDKTKGEDNTQPFYIAAKEDTTFGKSFHDLLESHLVNSGLPVAVSNSHNALTINYNVIGVNHETNRNKQQAKTFIGKVFRRSIVAIRDALTLGAFPEQNVPHSEVIVTVSIATANQYLMQNTFIYYINDPDFWHYENSTPSKIKIKLTNQ